MLGTRYNVSLRLTRDLVRARAVLLPRGGGLNPERLFVLHEPEELREACVEKLLDLIADACRECRVDPRYVEERTRFRMPASDEGCNPVKGTRRPPELHNDGLPTALPHDALFERVFELLDGAHRGA